MKTLKVKPLTAEAFSDFGDVIETAGNKSFEINSGMADRYHTLAKVDTDSEGGSPIISLVQSKKYEAPLTVKMVERHPLGSQAFIPRDKTPFVVIVAKLDSEFNVIQLHAFITSGGQGINYHAGVWHGPLLTPFDSMNFICVDRDGEGDNCQEFNFSDENQYLLDIE